MIRSPIATKTLYGFCIILITFSLFFIGVFFWRLQETTYSIVAIIIGLLFSITYGHRNLYNYRFVFPAFMALFLVIILPVINMIGLSFTNLSESNKLNYRRALPYILNQTYTADDGLEMKISGWANDTNLFIYLQDGESEAWYSHTSAIPNNITEPQPITLTKTESAPVASFDRKFAITHRNSLDVLTLILPNGVELTKNKLRSFAQQQKRFTETASGEFIDNMTGDSIHANLKTGEFEIAQSEDADRLGGFISPSFLKQSNLSNYWKLFSDLGQLKVFASVFAWSVFAATFTVTTTFFVAIALANILSWQAIRERETYKLIIVACYALPAFAVINSFFWMFTTTQAPWGAELTPGPIYAFVDAVFGAQLDWQFDPTLARIKFLLVQFWMFMPFMLIMCLGVIQSIPKSIYEAATIEGAGTRRLFFKITVPLTFIPLAPVLIIAFATAFNDLGLVNQLIVGVPEIPGSAPLAAYPDLLVSYANRQAFGNAYTRGSGFGFYSLASTLMTLIFVILAAISALYLRVVQFKSAGKEF